MAIVTSFLAGDFDTLARRALRQAQVSDLVELRLDRVGHPGPERLRSFLKECPKPVIVTVHGAEAFGGYQGSVDERCMLLQDAARAGARFVDIDWTLSLELGEVEPPCHRIVSRHELDGTPDDLEAFDAEVRELLYEGDAVKLVTHARCTEDGLRMLRHLRRARGGTIAFCSGRAGAFTRVLAPIFGSPFTYAAPAEVAGEAALEPTAPGQLRLNELLAQLPPGGLSHETAVLGVVGRPVHRSASPFVHGMALKHAHLDAVYVAFEPHDFDRFLDLADDPVFRGLSITAPFKEAAFRRSTKVEERARKLAAVNTLVRDGEGWTGSNTDVSAVAECVERAFGVWSQEPGRPVALPLARPLVLGAGGAARAAVGALTDLGCAVTVASRDPERGRRLASDLGCRWIPWDEIGTLEYDVLVNATPVGSDATAGPEGPQLVVPADWIRPGSLVLDAVYRPLRTPLLVEATRRGCLGVPGAEWFVRQAAAQYRRFTQTEPDDALLRKAFETAVIHGAGGGGAPTGGGGRGAGGGGGAGA